MVRSATKDSDAASLAEALLQSGAAAPQWLVKAATPAPRPAASRRRGATPSPHGGSGRQGGTAPRGPSAAALVAELKQQPRAQAMCAALSVLLCAVRTAVGKTAVGLEAAAFKGGKQGWAAHYAYEQQQKYDPVLEPWVELKPPSGDDGEWEAPPLNHGPEGPTFRPKEGAAPLGGPSSHLVGYLRQAGAALTEGIAASTARMRRWRENIEGGASPAPCPTAPPPQPPGRSTRHSARTEPPSPATALPTLPTRATGQQRRRLKRGRQPAAPPAAAAPQPDRSTRRSAGRSQAPPSPAPTEPPPSPSEAPSSPAETEPPPTLPPTPAPRRRGKRAHCDVDGDAAADAGAERHDGFTAPQLMVALFEYYYEPAIVLLMVAATNAKAREKVVKVSRGVLRVATAADDPSAIRQRALGWEDVTLEEMYVFLGVRILMGAYHRDRVVHYWHEGDDSAGMRVPLIAEAMKKDRHLEILSHLSFALPGVTKYAGNKLQKLKEVNDLLRDNCERAWDVEPDATLDESRLRLHSRYCSFVTQVRLYP